MNKLLISGLILLGALASFWAGSSFSGKSGAGNSATSGRKILYYVDPMNPAHTSDKPGLAPCGMKMEPVYADEAGGAAGVTLASLPPGSVKINTQKQQLIGVQVEEVEPRAITHTLRMLGRVAVDETRVYRINATVDGWITEAMPLAAGNLVKKDQTLATFYSPEFLSAEQALLFALNSQDRVRSAGVQTAAQSNQLTQFSRNIRQYTDSLENLGMGRLQIDDMVKTRKYQEDVNVVSPADGFIVARNVSHGQRFDKGTEMFRIVDLSLVWILAEVFEQESRHVKPGVEVKVTVPGTGQQTTAVLSDALPQFDNITRTLKLRLEAENADFALKPDMFVDIELPVSLPESLVVPVDAILDSGLRKVVYVDRTNGFFEPREIRAGWRVGDQVQVLQGLMKGERIVVSGNFLVDSESRMKLAASGQHGRPASKDPVCGMTVYEKDKAGSPSAEHEGRTYYFCCAGCQEAFQKDPARYLAKSEPSQAQMGAGHVMPAASTNTASHP